METHAVSSKWRPDERAKLGGEIIRAITERAEHPDADFDELARWYRMIPQIVRLTPEALEQHRDEFQPFVM